MAAYMSELKRFERLGRAQYAVLKALWMNPGASRVELGGLLGVSKVAASEAVKRLMELEMLEEREGQGGGRGRPAMQLAFKKGLLIGGGINFRNGRTDACLYDACGEILALDSQETVGSGWQARCDDGARLLESLLERFGLEKGELLGVGVALPGIFNSSTGVVVDSCEFRGDCGFNITEFMERRLSLPVSLANTSSILAHLERRFGVARGMRSFLYISSGFGMGMVLDGRLYRGSQTQAGEISYVQMNERGPRGFDGREGLLIDVAPFYRVTDRLEEIVEANGDTLLRNYMQPGSKGISVEMAAQAAGAGDMLCAELIGENFKIVSRLAVNLAYIFNPEAMIFDKWTSFCESCTLDVVRRHMGHYGVRHWGLKTQILSAACGEESLAGGSAMIPLDVFFEVDGFERVNKSHSKGRSAAL